MELFDVFTSKILDHYYVRPFLNRPCLFYDNPMIANINGKLNDRQNDPIIILEKNTNTQ
jgi:hypothetical protein